MYLYHWFISQPNDLHFFNKHLTCHIIFSTVGTFGRLSGPVGGSVDRHYQREVAPRVHYNKVTEDVRWLEAHPQLMDIYDIS